MSVKAAEVYWEPLSIFSQMQADAARVCLSGRRLRNVLAGQSDISGQDSRRVIQYDGMHFLTLRIPFSWVTI